MHAQKHFEQTKCELTHQVILDIAQFVTGLVTIYCGKMAVAYMYMYLALPILVRGCSNILVSSGASQDGNILVGDNDDSAKRHGLVTHFDGGHHPGIMCPVLAFVI